MTTFSYSELPDLTGGTCLRPEVDRTDWHPEGRGAHEQAARALKGCAKCPVRERCLTDALKYEQKTGASWGIWGGLTEYERAQLLKGAVA